MAAGAEAENPEDFAASSAEERKAIALVARDFGIDENVLKFFWVDHADGVKTVARAAGAEEEAA